MAKVPFSKLKLKTNEEVKILQLTDDISIEVKQYLPINEKLALIGRVIEWAHEQDYHYANPVKTHIYTLLEIVFIYTNLGFELDDNETALPELYDQLFSSGVLAKIIAAIPEDEITTLTQGILDSTQAVYQYSNSIVGVIDTITQSRAMADLDIKNLQTDLNDLTDSSFLKELLPLLALDD